MGTRSLVMWMADIVAPSSWVTLSSWDCLVSEEVCLACGPFYYVRSDSDIRNLDVCFLTFRFLDLPALGLLDIIACVRVTQADFGRRTSVKLRLPQGEKQHSINMQPTGRLSY
jgi:hypothetical protein